MSDSSSTALGTPSRGDRPASRTGRRAPVRRIATFYRQVVAELRKVIWPTRNELVTYTTVVVAFVLAMVAIVAVFDLAFGKAVLAVFGK